MRHAAIPRTLATPRPTTPEFSIVGIVGELLVAVGAILGLYVVWLLFFTDVMAGHSQDAALDALPWADVTLSSDSSSSDSGVLPTDLMYTDAAPVMTYPEFTETFATIRVPRWGEDYVKPVSEGVTRADVLDTLGIGHYPGTQMPGEVGNFAISGHRTTYGKPFTDIDVLRSGDFVVIQTEDVWYVYEVTSHEIVSPRAIEVIAPMPDAPGFESDNRYITLTSCHPRYSAAQRYVVHGVLKYWAPAGNGVPPELLEEPAP